MRKKRSKIDKSANTKSAPKLEKPSKSGKRVNDSKAGLGKISRIASQNASNKASHKASSKKDNKETAVPKNNTIQKLQDPFADREAGKYERPIPSREFILSHLKFRKAPANFRELVKELNLESDEEQLALHRRIKAMLREEQLEHLRVGYFWPAGHRILIRGRVQIEKGIKGKKSQAFVVPDDGSSRILLNLNEAHAVYQGNTVVVSVIDFEGVKAEETIREGHLVEILEQQRIKLTGRFVRDPGFNYVIPHGKEFTQDVLVPAGKDSGAKDGDIVIVEIGAPSSRWVEPIGTIIEILGHEDAPGIEILAATRAYGLPEEWPEPVQREIAGLTEEIPSSAKKGRLDIRHLPLVTIDGEDSKDFDDAVYCEKKPDGGWHLYVAIADVSHYVRPNTALDLEGRMRGNSVYFPGKVIPMLPEILSNGLCSLKPLVDRLCMVCILTISKEGKISRYDFHEAVMQSHARLTYTKVAAILAETSAHLAEQYAPLLPHLFELNNLYKTLRGEREKRGAIEFETIETRIIFGDQGKINRIEPVTRNDAHRIIEECMLCANVATARFLRKHKVPGLYRIHEGPPEEKLADLRIFLQELGLSLGGGKEPQPLDYAKLLRSIQNRSDANIIQSVMLRSLSQAVYSPDNVGHFGLAYKEYCHFTSPIRRYPDLLIHRQIRTVLQGKWTEKMQDIAKSEEAVEALVSLGDHTSLTERRADEATRDAVRWLKCEYIQKHIGDTFEGIISGVTRFGFFVELKDIYIDGLVHVTSLRNDYYYFDAIHHRLVGERSGIIYKLGDIVRVKVTRVAVHERKIDFDLVGSAKGSREGNFQGDHQGRHQGKRKGSHKKKKPGEHREKGREKRGEQTQGKPKQRVEKKQDIEKSNTSKKSKKKRKRRNRSRKKDKSKQDKSE